MSLKDEIEKLIRIEQEKIDAREQKHHEYQERQRQRFALVRTILQGITDSIEGVYIRTRIDDDTARIELGMSNGDYFETDIQWQVQPNFGTRCSASKDEGLFYEEAGFRVEETQYYHSLPEYHGPSEHTHIFPTESQTCEYLAAKSAEKVAQYRHLTQLAQRARKS